MQISKTFIASLTLLMAAAAYAGPMEDARQYVKEGDYFAAAQELAAAAEKTPSLRNNAEWNQLMGICRFESGNIGDSRKYFETAKTKGSKEATLYLGRLAFLDYDFEKAQSLYGDYRAYREKSGRGIGDDAEDFERQLMNAENALSRVEDLVVIDSIAVPVDGFFRHYRLPRSAGRLISPDEMPLEEHRSGSVVAFVNEGDDFMMWAEPDSVGTVRLVESVRLTDGRWQEPTPTPDVLNDGGYADYPFMMPDGTTLYYAGDGDGSMGGYDIFVATRDASTGEYLQPQNLGMPYNSPYDDFMLAIDELNGVGWWATDRNLLGDKLTVYVFLTNDIRKNLDPDDESLVSRARLTSIADTRSEEDETRCREALDLIKDIDPDAVVKKADFHFPVAGGKMLTTLDDFPGAKSKTAMKAYLDLKKQYESLREELGGLRRKYHNGKSENLRLRIKKAEADSEALLLKLEKARSDVYKALG